MTYSMHVWMNRFEPFLTFKCHGTSRLLSPSFLSLSFSYEHPIFCCYLVICPHDLPLKIRLALNIRLFLLKVRLFPIFHYPVQFPYSWRIHWPWPPRHVKYQTTAVEHCVAILHHQLPLDQHHLRLPRHHHLAQQHEKHKPDGSKHTNKGISEMSSHSRCSQVRKYHHLLHRLPTTPLSAQTLQLERHYCARKNLKNNHASNIRTTKSTNMTQSLCWGMLIDKIFIHHPFTLPTLLMPMFSTYKKNPKDQKKNNFSLKRKKKTKHNILWP